MSLLPPLITALILDLGDVLFTWSPDALTSVPWPIFKDMQSSCTWMDYERGRLSEYDCYARLASEFSIPEKVIATAYREARSSLRVNGDMVALIQELKASNDALQVYTLSNISIPDYTFVQTLPFEWSAFDAIFTSGLIGERKPDRAIYDRLIAATGMDPRSTVFVDDKVENVATARALGMHGIVFDCPHKATTTLRSLFLGPLQRAAQFMRTNAGKFASVTDDGGSKFMEYFAQLLILESTDDESLVSFPEQPFLWNFFQEMPLRGVGTPDDLDTTSIAYTVLEHDKKSVTRVMDEMLKYKTNQRLLLTYFDYSRHQVDAFINVNILTLFFRNGRGGDLPEALNYVMDVLHNRRYICGSRHYISPEMYLYFMCRLLDSDAALRSRTLPVFTERILERVGVSADPVDRAMRLIVCCKLGIDNEVDLRELLATQLLDGGWGVGWLYRYGKCGVRIGNRGVATAFAIRAIVLATQQNGLSSV